MYLPPEIIDIEASCALAFQIYRSTWSTTDDQNDNTGLTATKSLSAEMDGVQKKVKELRALLAGNVLDDDHADTANEYRDDDGVGGWLHMADPADVQPVDLSWSPSGCALADDPHDVFISQPAMMQASHRNNDSHWLHRHGEVCVPLWELPPIMNRCIGAHVFYEHTATNDETDSSPFHKSTSTGHILPDPPGSRMNCSNRGHNRCGASDNPMRGIERHSGTILLSPPSASGAGRSRRRSRV
ncbi:hypothetical protein SPI_02801 [Niveomyces insectorum RCEF 264]|uniref:Uncharacterized protein n=1 Tax=Niveomyces insectorum RCEF 264 TaxID=1081102 RepID=A0A167Y9D0_9HYPO|nr:hypothetical protein SPI_02801 [Niveomyces insectorum RCEF 264]